MPQTLDKHPTPTPTPSPTPVPPDYTQAEYTYNSMGQRVKNGETTLYYYDTSGRLISELDGSGNLIREYIYANGERVAAVTKDQFGVEKTGYILNDHLGAPKVVTDESKAVVWEAVRRPFGETTPTTSGYELLCRFPGQYEDTESGYFYNYFRDYDPSLGRYIESDPIGLGGGINPYVYVAANPISNTDPFGLLDPGTIDIPTIVKDAGAAATAAAGAATAAAGAGAAGAAAVCVLGTAGAAVGYHYSSQYYWPDLLDICFADNKACSEEDGDPECEKASPWQLDQARIESEHSFKDDWGARPNKNFDICACKDGSIRIKETKKCGHPGPSILTDATWK